MSRTFIGFGQAAYIGQPYSKSIKLGPLTGVSIPLFFQWISYGASTAKSLINVLVDFNGSACKALDQIRSVYIDNLGSAVPVYVYFPDTAYTVAAKPNSEGWYPAFTNERQIWVIGEGFLTGNIPQTYVMISNLPLSPGVNTEIDQSLNLQLASPVISRGTSIYNNLFGVPALGDQFQSSAQLNLNTGVATPLWGSPYSSGFIYLTGIGINLTDPNSGAAGPSSGRFVIESTGVAGTLIDLGFSAPGNTVILVTPVFSILNLSGMQVKLDATQTWQVRMTSLVSQGALQVYSSFTQQ